MKLHENTEEFHDLIRIVAKDKHISESAVERDYYIVMMLERLARSPYADLCVFKGGTSLSKCYPGSIERFSEDIDLTFLGMEMSDKECSKRIKEIEAIMSNGSQYEMIPEERFKRSKSMYVWHNSPADRIKLEIGSTVRPDPYTKKRVKTYIQEYLEKLGYSEDLVQYELHDVEINVLNVERTFIDKIMSVKRHAYSQTLNRKVRHIYDVMRLYQLPEIKRFMQNHEELKKIVQLTKNTDSYYLTKRNIPEGYDPTAAFDYESWKDCLNSEIRERYEHLHEDLLYSDEKQEFGVALDIFQAIGSLMKDIGE